MNIFEGLDENLKKKLEAEFGVDKKKIKEKRQPAAAPAQIKAHFEDKGVEGYFLSSEAKVKPMEKLDPEMKKFIQERFVSRKPEKKQGGENDPLREIEAHFLQSEAEITAGRQEEQIKIRAKQKIAAHKGSKVSQEAPRLDYEAYFLSLDD